jgi:putative hydrolase of the HAD superfamily
MAIQAVLFDMGGTIETFSHTRQLRLNAVPGLRKILRSAGISVPLKDDELLDLISAGLQRYHDWRLVTNIELNTLQIWQMYIFAGVPIDVALLKAVAEELMLYIETCFYLRAMRPDVPRVLEAIKEMGLKIGLISNVSSRGQVPVNLKLYGIDHYFDSIVLSSEYGRRKPDPAIFHYAARLMSVPTSECLYIGDRISRDIVGARRAGYGLAVQIRHNYQHGEQDEGAAPHAVIDQMSELVGILRAANSTAGHSEFRGIRAIIFDAGDILYYRPGRGFKLKAFLNNLSLDFVDNDKVEKQALTDQAYTGKITRTEYLTGVLRLYGVTQPEQICCGLRVMDEEDNDVHIFEGVACTLMALKKKGYLLGIITDTTNPLHTKLNWFEKGGFGDAWDSIISSYEMGVRKPHPDIYHAALKQLGLIPTQTVFVGHKASELEGARAVGMRTVAFNYDPEAKADIYIDNFSDLLNCPLLH